MVFHCVTCGSELHPERAEKYDYCTRPACRERNARPLTIAAVGVNKAADQYLVLNDQAKQDLAAGKYADQRKSGAVTDGPGHHLVPVPPARPSPGRRAGAAQPRRRAWTKAQEELALIYSARGMRPDEIGERLGVSRYTVAQMLLSAKGRAS